MTCAPPRAAPAIRPHRGRTRLSPASIPTLNRLALARHPIEGTIEGLFVSLRPGRAVFETMQPAPEETTIILAIEGGETIAVSLPRRILDRVAGRIQSGLAALPPGEGGALLIELTLAAFLEAAEAVIGRRVSVARIEPSAASEGVVVPFEGRFDGEAVVVRVLLGPEATLARPSGPAALLLHLLDTAPPPTVPLPDLPVRLDVVAGRLRLSTGRIRALEPGDALLPDSWFLDRGFVVIALGRTHAARGVLGPNGIELTTGLRPAAEMWPMTFPDDAEAQDDVEEKITAAEMEHGADADPEGLDAVDVTLTFQLGRLSVGLGTLRGMGPGTVFDLGLDHAEAVDIRANGTRIAHGEIVEIGERLGVRIVRRSGRN